MKSLFFTIFLALSFTASQAQGWFNKVKGNGNVITETRTTESYDQISAAGSFDVILVKGTEGKITLEGEENIISLIETEVKNNKLKVAFKKGVSISTRRHITITIPFEDLNAISFAGSGNLKSEYVIKADELNASLAGSGDVSLPLEGTQIKISVSGSGNFKAQIKSQNLKTSLAGSGDIELDGESQTIEIAVSGSGDVDAKNLRSDSAKISVAGSGDVLVTSRVEIYARVSGSGTIGYYGRPQKEDIKVSGSGRVSMQ
ncbi:MAG: head GIN domain-containing protein [Flavobacteriaceae bacterium]|nr:head GIN domain-containing protein [Flavobacteriaceae bacterium]